MYSKYTDNKEPTNRYFVYRNVCLYLKNINVSIQEYYTIPKESPTLGTTTAFFTAPEQDHRPKIAEDSSGRCEGASSLHHDRRSKMPPLFPSRRPRQTGWTASDASGCKNNTPRGPCALFRWDIASASLVFWAFEFDGGSIDDIIRLSMAWNLLYGGFDLWRLTTHCFREEILWYWSVRTDFHGLKVTKCEV
jgi:hypothetical protein